MANKYFPDLQDGKDCASVEPIKEGFNAVENDIDAANERIRQTETSLNKKENTSNKVTQISDDSTDVQFPSALSVYTAIHKNMPTAEIDSELPMYISDFAKDESLIGVRAYAGENGGGDLEEESGGYKLKLNACGKNIFNPDEIFLSCEGWTSYYDEEGNKVYKGPVGKLYAPYSQAGMSLPLNNKKLAISCEAKNETKNDITTYFQMHYSNGKTQNLCIIRSNEWTKLKGVTSRSDILKIIFGYTQYDTVHIRNVQIEEAEAVSEYEPYCGTSAEVELDTQLVDGEYVDLIRKKRVSAEGESDITVNGKLKAPNSDTFMLWTENTNKPESVVVEYYQDISKVINELKNAILSQGANV